MTDSRQTSSTPMPSENLRHFVATGDLDKARAALRTELDDNCADRQTLLAALAYARERIEGLCEPYAVRPFADAIDPDRSHWTEAYHDAQLAFLKANFAAERYDHLVQVRLQLRERGVRGFVARAAGELPTPPDLAAFKRAPRRSRRLLLAVALCGGAVVVAALGFFGKTQ